MKEMRRQDRAITHDEALEILENGQYGVLSTVAADGKPYGVPLSFCVVDRSLYFHCAVEGQKLDNLERNRSVSFCVVGNVQLLPEQFGTRYQSVVVAGQAEEVFAADKQAALEALVHKYSPQFVARGLKYIDAMTPKARVFRITMDTVTGKARKL